MGSKPNKDGGEPVRSRGVKSRGVRSRGSKRETVPEDGDGLESVVERRGATPLRLPNSGINEPRSWPYKQGPDSPPVIRIFQAAPGRGRSRPASFAEGRLGPPGWSFELWK